MAVGLALLSLIGPGDSYFTTLLPAMLVFAFGLVLVVAPVTTAALLEVTPDQSGTASGVNNAVARVAGLIAIAVLPAAAGIAASGDGLASGFRTAQLISAALCAVGALIAAFGFETRESAPRH
jgi:hypothetical protein